MKVQQAIDRLMGVDGLGSSGIAGRDGMRCAVQVLEDTDRLAPPCCYAVDEGELVPSVRHKEVGTLCLMRANDEYVGTPVERRDYVVGLLREQL